ncbi:MULTISPECIES: response regulator transcription factor [unclassified Rhizobium]|uniref:LuxR C-terminal-related transcriptional regulator n=1 Tax=unclassified Rhizobium TaxID=2613769 RepID=UPI00160CF8A0|nr:MULTISPECIES: response regulator transcription factor [unclassified Rhizobium]MBB3317459.1 DNA-binding NarL/FixJ family response regulator [Rhizobium sp. BK181]MBB3543199.1 DNA-binding NarL/FixJ family response regulator [Rhizobium sp. BK399]MCS3744354.1 DNA-binding NarL/FixJ family response regulator [Rhizobium sp. BK661]MCS4096637.1 DNA-binding NarL/FixJ family response regulator [Rhizobium sp. BK176]
MLNSVRVAFVDDHPMLLEGIGAVFARHGRYDVVAKGSDADAARAIAARYEPHLIFVDLSMPGDVYGAISDIAATGRTQVIVYTACNSVDLAVKSLDSGASAFILKESISNELFGAVDAVIKGEVFISPSLAGKVISALKGRRKEGAAGTKLSHREEQVVALLLKARSNKEIALSLSISEKTVKHYMANLMTKLNARNRVEVALAAQQHVSLTS